MAYSQAERNAAKSMVHMGQSGVYAYTRPSEITSQPRSAVSGQPKLWIGTPYTSKFGTYASPHWASPPPTLFLNKKYKKHVVMEDVIQDE